MPIEEECNRGPHSDSHSALNTEPADPSQTISEKCALHENRSSNPVVPKLSVIESRLDAKSLAQMNRTYWKWLYKGAGEIER